MIVVRDGLWLCTDCTIVAVNDDVSGIHFSYGVETEASEKRIAEVYAGLAKLGPHLVPDNSEDEGRNEHSSRACDCCGDWRHGSRERFAILGENTD